MRKRFIVGSVLSLLFTLCFQSLFGAWQPGLNWSSVSGANQSNYAAVLPGATTNTSLSVHMAKTTSGWGGSTVYIYWGQIYLDGSVYKFGENIDDAVTLVIDSERILNNAGWNTASFGTIERPAGWYDFEVRLFNGTGGAGPVAGSGFTSSKGFGYVKGTQEEVAAVTTGDSLLYVDDPGDCSFLRYDDGTGFHDRLEIAASPDAFSTPSPDYGIYQGYSEGDELTLSCPAEFSGEKASARLAGWRLYECGENAAVAAEIASGTGSTVNYTHGAKSARLVWIWEDVKYKVEATAGEGGSLSYQGGWVDLGGNLSMEALPGQGYDFYKWEGDVPAAQLYSPVLSIEVSSPISVRALFMPKVCITVDGSDSASGATWDDPASLKRGLEFASAPASLVLSNGIYSVDAEIILTNAVKISGLAGDPEDVILRRPSTASKYRIFTLNHEESVVSSVSIEGGLTIGSSGVYNVNGGGVLIEQGGGTISHCIVRNNRAEGHHGSGSAIHSKSAKGRVTRTVVTNNTTTIYDTNYGGAVAMHYGIIDNSLVAYNSDMGSTLGGMITLGEGARAENCTVVMNKAKANSGIYAAKTTAVAEGCVIAYNSTTGARAEDAVWTGNASSFVSCVSDMYAPNENCYSGAGLALNHPEDGDFRPTAASVAIDYCAGLASPKSQYDLDGNVRLSGNAIDAGCYEFSPEGLVASFSVDRDGDFVPADVTFTATVFGANEGDVLSYHWDFDLDGTVDMVTDGPAANWTYSRAGIYSASLTVQNHTTTESASAERQRVFSANPKTLYVKEGNALSAPPYDNRENASSSIQDAIDYASTGAEVVVLSGVYPIKSALLLDKEITLRSETGNPEDVIVKRDPSVQWTPILHMNAGKTALVSGVTLEGGKGNGGSGGNLWIHTKGGTVSNAVIRGGNIHGKWARGGGFVVDSENGLLTHCVISNNSSNAGQYDGGNPSGTAGDLLSGRLEHCLIVKNYPGYSGWKHTVHVGGGTMRYCTVADNVSSNCAGINITGGSVEATLIARNFSAKEDPAYRVWGSSTSIDGMTSNASNSSRFLRCLSDGEAINQDCFEAGERELFRSPADGDWRHKSHSAAIDRILPVDGEDMPSIGLDGLPRLVHRLYDIGCYESVYFPPPTVLMLK